MYYMYKLLYLPSKDQTFTDNCDVIDTDGKHHGIINLPDATMSKYSGVFRVAEPFIVSMAFNQMTVIGIPSPKAMVFLQNGSDIKDSDTRPAVMRMSTGTLLSEDVDHYYSTADVFPDDDVKVVLQVRCPSCREWH